MKGREATVTTASIAQNLQFLSSMPHDIISSHLPGHPSIKLQKKIQIFFTIFFKFLKYLNDGILEPEKSHIICMAHIF